MGINGNIAIFFPVRSTNASAPSPWPRTTYRRIPAVCVSMPKPLEAHSCRFARKRCGICKMAINVEGIRKAAASLEAMTSTPRVAVHEILLGGVHLAL
jgi:hypothetical protein